MVERERNAQGRAQNARPRDALGRPLPRGAVGVGRVPEDLVLEPLPALAEAQRLLDARMPFHAHEVLEASWKAAPDQERELWQGLAQLAVGLTHVLRGNPTGAATLLGRARRRISLHVDDPPYGIDAAGLIRWCDEVLRSLGSSNVPVEPVTPTLRQAQGG
ncbi:MAG: DUF309 domain-containing protein [Janthinobacterium lividum]